MTLQREDGVGFTMPGTFRVLDGQLYLDDRPFTEILGKEFANQYIEMEVFKPAAGMDGRYPIDEKIRPLVEALQRRGFVTLSSCEGHMDAPRFGGPGRRAPWVTLYVKGKEILLLQLLLESNWCVCPVSDDGPEGEKLAVVRIHPEKEAETEEELAELQRQALDLARKISA